MKKASIFFLAALTVTLVFFGCNKNKTTTDPIDTEPPTIIMSSPEVVPEGEYVSFTSLNPLPIDIRFEDNVGLANYEIKLGYAPWLYYEKTENFPWEKLIVGTLDGRVGGYNDTITVPYDPSAGPHIFDVNAWDAAGNKSSLRTYLFIINANDVTAPIITITVPTTAVDSVTHGQQMIIQGTMTEPGGLLQRGRIQIRNSFNNIVEDWSVMELDSLFMANYTVDTFMDIPAGTPPGDYILEMYGQDFIQNVGSDTASFYIKSN